MVETSALGTLADRPMVVDQKVLTTQSPRGITASCAGGGRSDPSQVSSSPEGGVGRTRNIVSGRPNHFRSANPYTPALSRRPSMRVAMVTPYWLPIRGGVTTFVAGLSEALQPISGVEIHIVAREGTGAGATILGGTKSRFVQRLVRELQTIKPDVVHAHGHWYVLLGALRYAARNPGVATIFTLHTEISSRSWIRRWFLGNLLSKADAVTALSQHALSTAIRKLRILALSEVIPPGVAISYNSPERIQDFLDTSGLGKRKPLVTFVGPLAWGKKAAGVALLIRAFHEVRKLYPGATLAIAGDGLYRARLEALADETIPGGAVFLGDIPDPAPLLMGSDIYAHVTFQEGFGLAVLEAMAAGTPIVASRTGGIPEIIRDGDNGLLVDSAEDIVRRIQEILNNPTFAAQLTDRARLDVRDKFHWSRTAQAYLALYNRCIRRKGQQ